MSSAGRRIQTERLVLRQWREDDLDGLAAMNADPEVMRYIHDGHVHDRPEAAASLGRIRAQWAEHGFGLWAVEGKQDGSLMGFCGVGFPRFLPALEASPEIGWRFARRHWGTGYASEAAVASRNDFFSTQDFDHLISLAFPGNLASHRVMQKLGMRRVADATLPSGATVWVHRLERDDWTAA
jgi:RimJ/RimL family protein N-acetyltransferase